MSGQIILQMVKVVCLRLFMSFDNETRDVFVDSQQISASQESLRREKHEFGSAK